MLSFERHPDGDLTILQFVRRPCVYMDHWAWRTFGDNRALADRFVKAIKDRNGTVAISWLNVLEFLPVVRRQQIYASGVAERLFPNLIFLAIDPFEVQALEINLLDPNNPYLDCQFSRGLCNFGSTHEEPLSVKHIFAQKSEKIQRLKRNKAELAGLIVGRVRSMRSEIISNDTLQADLRRNMNDKRFGRSVTIQREYLRSLLLDSTRNFSHNDAIDMLHTVVPTAYCDFVLLDKGPIDQVNRISLRIKKSELDFPLPKIFAKGQIEDFLRLLEDPNTPNVLPNYYFPLIPQSLRTSLAIPR